MTAMRSIFSMANMDVDAILFGGEDDAVMVVVWRFPRRRGCGCRKQNAAMKIAARFKLLWIALAIHNPAAARDVLR
jgi:hypothetical protein